MLMITTAAQDKIIRVLSTEGPGAKLRMFVSGKGCAGMTYGFAIDDEIAEDDIQVPAGETTVLVDAISLPYLQGSIVDFKEDLTGSKFVISNPNAKSSCGCGDSFQPKDQ